MATKIEIITIGDEILQGQIVDTNSAWMAQQLLQFHFSIVQITTIADRQEAIVEAFEQAQTRAEVILVTGGLGPTKDDITKKTAAEYFGTSLVRDQKVLEHVRSIFSKRNREMPAINEMQADVFADGEVLFNAVGTAPGLWFKHKDVVFIFMPGVPFEMKYIMSEHVLPRLSERTSTGFIENRYILTAGVGESHLATSIADIEAELPEHIRLAYLPKLGIVRLRLTGTGSDASVLNTELEEFAQRIKTRMDDAFVSFGNVEMESALLSQMASRKLTLATAESCTGGDIAARITSVPGSGDVYKGSIISYANEIKMNLLSVSETDLAAYGPVSEPVVKAMAIGARTALNVDYAVATSGLAGPDGGTEDLPVGTIWIAVASPKGVLARLFHFHNDRAINIERATTNSLLLLWEVVKDQNSTV